MRGVILFSAVIISNAISGEIDSPILIGRMIALFLSWDIVEAITKLIKQK